MTDWISIFTFSISEDLFIVFFIISILICIGILFGGLGWLRNLKCHIGLHEWVYFKDAHTPLFYNKDRIGFGDMYFAIYTCHRCGARKEGNWELAYKLSQKKNKVA